MDTHDLMKSLVVDLQPVAPLAVPWRRAARWSLSAAAGLAVGLSVYGLRADLVQALRELPYLLRVCGLVLAVAVSIVGALQLAVPGPPVRLRGTALAIVGGLASIGAVALLRAMLSGDFSVWSYGWDCLGKVTIAAAMPAAAGVAMVERGAPLAARSARGLAALAAGAVGCLAAELACPEPEPAHVFVWHLLPAVLIGLGGALLPRRHLQPAPGLSRT